jgi:hypothetical protein
LSVCGKMSVLDQLPIPLDELWFDYLTTPLKQGFRLDITAIRQESANAEYIVVHIPGH